MAGGKTLSIGCPHLLIGRNRAHRVQKPTTLLKEATVAWRRFPKDTALPALVPRILRHLSKPFRAAAAAATMHRRSLSTQANIFALKEQPCTPKTFECVQVRSNAIRQNSATTTPNLSSLKIPEFYFSPSVAFSALFSSLSLLLTERKSGGLSICNLLDNASTSVSRPGDERVFHKDICD